MTGRSSVPAVRRTLAVARTWLWAAVFVGSVVAVAGASAGLATAVDWWASGGAH